MNEDQLLNLLHSASPKLLEALATAYQKSKQHQHQKAKILLTRHQISDGNVNNSAYSIHGDHDTPAHQQQAKQSKALGEHMVKTILPALDIEQCPQIWTSPAIRAKQTAATVLKAIEAINPDFINLDQEVIQNEFLSERYLGVLLHLKKLKSETFTTNLEREIFQKLLQAQQLAHEKDPYYTAPLFGESPRLKSLFTESTTEKIFEQTRNGQSTHWLFTHADEIKAHIHDFLNLDGHTEWLNFTIHNCDTYLISNENNGWQAQKIYDGLRQKPVLGKIHKEQKLTMNKLCQKYRLT